VLDVDHLSHSTQRNAKFRWATTKATRGEHMLTLLAAELISAANIAKNNMLTFYDPSNPAFIPGYLLNPNVYYWWQAGGMLGQLIQHWNITGNSSLNEMITRALVYQVGPSANYMPPNQSSSEGNDDQVFWGFAAMDAAEYNFPAPDPKWNVNAPSYTISWLGMAQAVFNTQVPRWDTANCGGGLRWQITYANTGWNYKNMPSNGGFFMLAARLARFTGNSTYGDWATKVWDWAEGVGFIAAGTTNGAAKYTVYDGAGINLATQTCNATNKVQFSYNVGMLMMGSAMMYNYVSRAHPEHPPTALKLTTHRPTAARSGATASSASSTAWSTTTTWSRPRGPTTRRRTRRRRAA